MVTQCLEIDKTFEMSVEQKLEDIFLATGGGKVEGGETVRIGGSEIESELKKDFQNFGVPVL
jgi:hypothetical protein